MTTTIKIEEISISLLEEIKALLLEKKVVFSVEKDDSKMSKEDFFAKIDKAREGKSIKMSREEMRNFLLNKAQ